MSKQKKETVIAVLKELMGKKEWAHYVTLQAMPAVGGVLAGISIFFIFPISEALLYQARPGGLDFAQWLIVIAIIALASSIIEYYRNAKVYSYMVDLMDKIYQRLGDTVASLPIGAFSSREPGFFSRLVAQELLNLMQYLAEFTGTLVKSVVSMIAIMVISWFWHWEIGLFFTIAVPISLLMNKVGIFLKTYHSKEVEQSETRCANRIVEFARCQGAFRAYHVGINFPELQDALERTNAIHRKALIFETISFFVQGLAANNIPVVMCFMAVSLAQGGILTPLEAFLAIGISLRIYIILNDTIKGAVGFASGIGTLRGLTQTLNRQTLQDVEQESTMKQPGSLAVKNVSFGYEPSKSVVNDISFTVEPQSMCAIVGPSGCGKTTIARLIARFWDVDSGEISVSGAPIKQLKTETLMDQLSMVFQDVYLFNDTLWENVRLGNLRARDEEILWAADLAGVSEIVDRLPEGWQTRAGEGGRSLSGGERQRISIARALLKRAPITLFDEATSALDAENEAHIVAAMDELKRTSTLVVIAHKLETIKQADQIIVLSSEGTIAQQGTHEMLIDQEGPYQRFWQARSNASGWKLV